MKFIDFFPPAEVDVDKSTQASDVFSQLFSSGSDQIKISEFPAGDYCFGVFANGLFEKETISSIGTFITLKKDFEVPGLASHSNSFTFSENFKLIPIGILHSLIAFYRKVMTEIKSEVMTMIVYDTVIQDYKIMVPIQKVSGSTVKYEPIEFAPHEIYIMGHHSHVNMSAFFSAVDNNDEKKAMFYGVIGKLSQESPEIVLRAKKGVFSFPLEVKDLFDESVTTSYKVPDEELRKITQTVNGSVFPGRGVASTVYNATTYTPRVMSAQTTVYDYRRNNTNSSYWNYDDDEEAAYSTYLRSRAPSGPTLDTEFDFVDPEVSSTIREFVTCYTNYVKVNISFDISEEEKVVAYGLLTEAILSIVEAIDVDSSFYEIFSSATEELLLSFEN